MLMLSLYGSLAFVYRTGSRFPEMSWASDYAYMLGCSILAYLFTGAFLSAAYQDLAWHLFALVVILKEVTRRELAALTLSQASGRPATPARSPTFMAWPPKPLPAPTPGFS
jgi:hypothetical protein